MPPSPGEGHGEKQQPVRTPPTPRGCRANRLGSRGRRGEDGGPDWPRVRRALHCCHPAEPTTKPSAQLVGGWPVTGFRRHRRHRDCG